MDASHLERNRKVRAVLASILVANWAVALAKLGIGIFSQSAAVTADGLHSFIDGGSNVLGLLDSDATVRFSFGFFLEMGGGPRMRLFRQSN